MNKECTYIYLPGGEWLPSFLMAMQLAGMELARSSERCYEWSLADQALPIIFIEVRSKDVPRDVFEAEAESLAFGGFTGSDVAVEQGVPGFALQTSGEIDRSCELVSNCTSWTFPLWDLNSEAIRPALVLGSTPNLRGRVKRPQLADLRGTTIYTAYPQVTKQLLYREGVNAIAAKVVERAGKIEGRWRTNPNNGAIVDITSSGSTLAANEIEIMSVVMRPEIVYLQNEAMGKTDKERVEELRRQIYMAAEKMRRK